MARQRLIDSATRVAGERGYAKTTVAEVVRGAGVSRRTFYMHFSTKRSCLMAAREAFFERLWLEVMAAAGSQEDWPWQVRTAMSTCLDFLGETGVLAREFGAEVAVVGPDAAAAKAALIERFASQLRSGRRLYPSALNLPPSTELALIGGVVSIVSDRLLGEEAFLLSELEPELVEHLLIPYLGRDEARRVART